MSGGVKRPFPEEEEEGETSYDEGSSSGEGLPAMRGAPYDFGPDSQGESSSASGGKRKGKRGRSPLSMLVDALDQYQYGEEEEEEEGYSDEGEDEYPSLGKGRKGRRRFDSGDYGAYGGEGYGDEEDEDVGLLGGQRQAHGRGPGGYGRGQQRGGRPLENPLTSDYGFVASEMNPKLAGKRLPKLLGEAVDMEYYAAPFDQPLEGQSGLEEADLLEDEAEWEAEERARPEGSEVPWPRRPFRRQRRVNRAGMGLVLLYSAALVFYLFVRIKFTLDLGNYIWWGVFVLVVELLGASTTLLYGLNIIFDPIHEELPDDEHHVGYKKVARPYHVRVLVPCYKESLEIVGRTIQEAHNAPLPHGCKKTIYLCDDGKDDKKRRWCEQNGPDFVYVSGRIRAPGEMNGKSANLNNCLSQIYPPGTQIPNREIVCIFDADQVANRDFFMKTLPLFDAGDDVGMVLSPQCFHNLDPNADIFNHGNVQFWEYAQHGYDAIGFNSCTGTNFLTRARAFQQAGWSPTYTLTEDYALGMELTKNRWHCRYVEEYLAVGEAPDQVRNCFQQRSRWAKGHFQIVFSGEHCPLFQPGLRWGYRVLYCSGVWAYFVGALTTPVFIAVPLVTIWAGVFPIVVSWWAALGLTIYFLAQFLVLNYVRRWKHVKPLWFANVANNILWWTFVKACWRAVGSACGKGITFKTTLKGTARLVSNTIGDLWMPTACFLALVASLGFGLYKVATGPSIVTTLSISLVWIIYVTIPPYLLLHYAFIGKGATLRWACKLLMGLSTLCGLIAIVLLWNVYPAQYDYGHVVGLSRQFELSQRVGKLPADYPIPWRGDALTYERGPAALGFGSLAGGWMTNGLAGTVKVTLPTAFAVSMSAWSLLEFPQGYAQGNRTGEALDSLRWGADYLLKTFVPDTRSVEGALRDYYIVYQVGNYTADSAVWTRPEDITGRRPVYYTTTKNGTSDLAGQIVGALVSTALVFQDTDPAYFQQLMTSAMGLYGAGVRRRGRYTRTFLYACAPPDPTLLLAPPVTANCKPPDIAFDGSMVYNYNSTSFRDDLAWAASWMYKATRDPGYLADAYNYWQQHIEQEGDLDLRYLVDWDNMIYPASVLLAELTDDMAFHSKAQAFLQKWLCSSGNTISYTPLGRAYNRFSPGLGTSMNAAFLSIVYGNKIAPPSNIPRTQLVRPYSDGYKSQRYLCWTRKQSRYILGDHGYSYVVGFGRKYSRRPADRGASCPEAPANCTAVNALYNPEANPHTIYGALVNDPRTWDYFSDSRTSNDTWVGMSESAGLLGAVAGLNQVMGTYDQCLQGYGVLARDTAICDGSIAG